jgi:hypothetical protein
MSAPRPGHSRWRATAASRQFVEGSIHEFDDFLGPIMADLHSLEYVDEPEAEQPTEATDDASDEGGGD